MQYGRSLKTGSGAKKTMNYLHYALRYPKRTARKIIWAYGKSLGLEKPVIDLPEEYPEISHLSSKPDTMITWISNDTIKFRFLVAAGKFPAENH